MLKKKVLRRRGAFKTEEVKNEKTRRIEEEKLRLIAARNVHRSWYNSDAGREAGRAARQRFHPSAQDVPEGQAGPSDIHGGLDDVEQTDLDADGESDDELLKDLEADVLRDLKKMEEGDDIDADGEEEMEGENGENGEGDDSDASGDDAA